MLSIAAAAGSAAAGALRVVDGAGNAVAEAVVSLHPLDAPAPERDPQLHTIEQHGLRFVPHVSVIGVGDQVNFPNQDPVRHHIYSFSKPRPLEIKLYSGLPASPLDFPSPGVVVLGCNIHDWMLGFILVLDTPWWSLTDAAGMAAESAAPPGRYRVQVWHSRQPATAALLTREVVLPLSADEIFTLQLAPAPDLDPPALGMGG